MAKKTIEEVREFIKENSNGKCELLSNEYINNKTPLLIRCSCGNIFERKFSNINKNFIQCKECTNKMRSEKYRESIEVVINTINSTGCEYISGKYENERSLLKIRCRCGKIFEKSYAKFISGQDRCPDCGNENVRNSKIKYTVEDIQKRIAEKGYVLLEKEYLGAQEKMRCRCSKGHEFDLVFSQYLIGCSGCSKCAHIEKSGKNHPNYNGGNSKVSEALRNCIDSWRNEIMKTYNFHCPISGDIDNLVVHHLESFSDIVKKCSEIANVPIYKKINEYKDYSDFVLLKDTIINYHTGKIGILISKKIHSDFHKKYGTANNTAEQFDEYLKKEFGIRLEDVMNTSEKNSLKIVD